MQPGVPPGSSAQVPQQGYAQAQQYPMPGPQYLQAPAPAAPPQPLKDTVVAEEVKRYAASISWTVAQHQQQVGLHVIGIAPPAGRKLARGDVKRATVFIRSMGPQPQIPGVAPSGANTVQLSLETEEKAGLFGTDRKSYPPIWLNADEEVDASMQPRPSLMEKIRNLMTQARVAPPPAPAPPPQPPQPPQPAPQYPPQYPQQYPSPAPAPQPPAPGPLYQTPYPQQVPYQYQQPAPQYQPPPGYAQQGPPPGYQMRPCPACQQMNPPNAVACHRCGARLL
ncbi:MAG: hypothetical protein ACUVV6_08275 [Thermoplasmatota archaeon]